MGDLIFNKHYIFSLQELFPSLTHLFTHFLAHSLIHSLPLYWYLRAVVSPAPPPWPAAGGPIYPPFCTPLTKLNWDTLCPFCPVCIQWINYENWTRLLVHSVPCFLFTLHGCIWNALLMLHSSLLLPFSQLLPRSFYESQKLLKKTLSGLFSFTSFLNQTIFLSIFLSLSVSHQLLPFSQLLPRPLYEGQKLLKKTFANCSLSLPIWSKQLTILMGNFSFCLRLSLSVPLCLSCTFSSFPRFYFFYLSFLVRVPVITPPAAPLAKNILQTHKLETKPHSLYICYQPVTFVSLSKIKY